ncbi:ABC transporter related protein [Denitrovibrio acetiphilus DSM 12809]|uniref:ABC transporter related protein n=1 Tax=Denitrovibrio acetiphilus (strain DSM 12809 / NBRC 114555 / N2460) TaxID=522772 RepID=D4H680_DENA2|nr:ABC transporter ATP-binding protein [Denitrovibrio acetiphilus]ADD67726.1 ABC transporter related protein [Denitrovibrio acetiphilus DSM 12809]
MIEIKELVKKFGDQTVLNSINLTVSDKEKLMILGQNGAGKTTLMRCILGEYKPDAGSIVINGYQTIEERVKSLEKISFVPQLPPPLRQTVRELINYSSSLTGFDKGSIANFCQKMDLDIEPHYKKPFFKLSGGMKQKVLISIALARDSNVLIFDEPTANLDLKGRERFYDLINEYCMDKILMFISHRVEDLAGLANRKIELDIGKIVSDEKI